MVAPGHACALHTLFGGAFTAFSLSVEQRPFLVDGGVNVTTSPQFSFLKWVVHCIPLILNERFSS